MTYSAQLNITKLDDGRFRAEVIDTDPEFVGAIGSTAEDAAVAAVGACDFNSMFELSAPEPVEPSTLGLARRVAVAPDDIKALVEANKGTGNLLRIDYRDTEGVLTTNRLIEPKNTWNNHPATDWTYMRAYDHGRREQRTFRLDRIERAELVEGRV
jgi:hypothetical protein